MFEKYFRRPESLRRLRAGPFTPELEALVKYLERRGHRHHAIRVYITAAATLAASIVEKRLSLENLTMDGLQDFARQLARRLPGGYPRKRAHGNLICVAPHLFAVLCDLGRCQLKPAIAVPRSPLGDLLERFDRHLEEERGLAKVTRTGYRRELESVLSAKFGNDIVKASVISAHDVRRWIASRAAATTPRTARALAVSLACLLRFFILQGEPVQHILDAIPRMQVARLSGVPNALSDQQLAQLIQSIDESTPIGLRARAIVECAAVLGLRAKEIAALRLSDIDWREGVLHLQKTKSRRVQALPLTRDVGRALVAYLKRGRPKSSTDRIFVCHYFPVGKALTSESVTSTVRRAMARAGLKLPSTGAHVLRHTAASRLLRGGAGMKEIADVLRHRDIDTTRAYAKVDWPRLREIALPWPAPVAP